MASDRTWISVWIRCAIGGFVGLRVAVGEMDCDFLGDGIEHNVIDARFGCKSLVLLSYCGRNARAPGRQDERGNQQQEKSRFGKNISDRKKTGPFVFEGAHGVGTITIPKMQSRCKCKSVEGPRPNKSTGVSML